MKFLTFSNLAFLFFFLTQTFSFAQGDTHGVLRPKDPINGSECRACKNAFRKKPKEVQFILKKDNQDNLFFEITHKEWLNTIFKGSKDGFLVDIISKEKYNCNLSSIPKSTNGIEGTSLPPVFSKKIKAGLKKQPNGRYRVKIGSIPKKLKGQELEFNLFFINDNYFCQYSRIYNLESYELNLLDMGAYLDSITYNRDIRKPSEIEGYKVKYKTLQFKIPFERNKAEYSAEDIKPVYDSLNLTTFDIKKINIKAYSSVEGSVKRNLELQSQRAESIANAMQQFQTPKIETSISATENWSQFLNDIQNTKYASFSDLSQKDIKAKLLQKDVLTDLDPYLKNHRKAIIILDLDKKDPYKSMDPKQLFNLFNEKIASNNLKEASIIQNAIFKRISTNGITFDKLRELEIPKEKAYLNFLIKNASIKYLLDPRQGMIAYNELLALDKLFPNNHKIKYNLAAIKFIIWENEWEPVDTKKFKKEILSLSNYGVPKPLIDRMLINFNLLITEGYLYKGDFKNKDKSATAIFTKFKNATLHDDDFLNLANYFSRFSNHDFSKKLLQSKVQNIEVSEDLLFYYLNLTIIDNELTKQKEYRSIMLNAYSKNPERFCKLFNSIDNGGITFQLLENNFLRKNYCESCNK